MIGFAHSLAFLALPLPVLVWMFWPPVSARQHLMVPASVSGFLQAAARGTSGRRARPSTAWLPITLGWVALVVALAAPFTKTEKLILPTGRDFVVAIDYSASMAVEDMTIAGSPVARIDVATDVVGNVVSAQQGDRIGLIAFASEAFVITPLTFDGGAVSGMLDDLVIGLPGRKTDIGRAIGMAVQMFRDLPKAKRVLVMLSDGETNAGGLTALDAARLAKDHGIVIHMIGFAGTIEPDNETHMREIAALTGGEYWSAARPDTLQQALEQINALVPISANTDDPHVRRDLSPFAMMIALAAALVAGWLELRKR